VATVLIAGGDPTLVDGVRDALRSGGLDAAIAVAGECEPPARVDAAVIAPNWRAEPLPACLRFLSTWTEAVLPLLIGGGTVIVAGPPVVSMPGPGYADYVKARLVLGRVVRELATDPNGVRAVAVWHEDAACIPHAVAEATIGGLGSRSRLRSAGAAFNA
jgi:hypothetical protein